MGETISDIDVELQRKYKKIQFLEDKIGTPDSEIVEEMNRLDSNEISSQDKCDRIFIRLYKTPYIL